MLSKEERRIIELEVRVIQLEKENQSLKNLIEILNENIDDLTKNETLQTK